MSRTQEQNAKRLKNILSAIVLIIIVALVVLLIVGRVKGYFDSAESLGIFIQNFGPLAPLAFTVIRIILVIAPVFPVPIVVAATAVIFGPWYGFLYMYVGNVIGSIIGYWLGKTYGPAFVKGLISEKAYNKCVERIAGKKNYSIFYAIAVSTPLFPDDIFVYFSGLGKQSFKTFILTVLLCKPFVIALYCLVFGGVISLGPWFNHLIGAA